MNNKFDIVQVGMNVQEVIEIMGCPDVTGNLNARFFTIICGSSEFLFENGTLLSKKIGNTAAQSVCKVTESSVNKTNQTSDCCAIKNS